MHKYNGPMFLLGVLQDRLLIRKQQQQQQQQRQKIKHKVISLRKTLLEYKKTLEKLPKSFAAWLFLVLKAYGESIYLWIDAARNSESAS